MQKCKSIKSVEFWLFAGPLQPDPRDFWEPNPEWRDEADPMSKDDTWSVETFEVRVR